MTKLQQELFGEEFKGTYRDALQDAGADQNREAYHLCVSQSTASHYQNPSSPERHLPVYLAPHSLAKDAIAEWLARQCGGAFVKISGKAQRTFEAELREVLRASADLVKEQDPSKREKLWQKIAMEAELALGEGGK